MTVEEMHIGIDMDLQKVNTYTQKNLLPQEKDFFLNGEVLKFIKQRINPRSNTKGQGVDSVVKRYEDLSDLRKTEELDVRVNSDGDGEVILPDDYYSYISSKTNVYQECITDTLTKISSTEYLCDFPLSFDPSTTLSIYTITLNKPSGNVILFNIADLPTGYIQNVDINKQQFMLLKAINILVPEVLDGIATGSYSFYWENYSDTFKNNTFTLVSDEIITSISVNINGTTTTYNGTSNVYQKYNETSPLWSKNRLIEEEFQDEIEHSSLSQSRPESPVIDLKQQIITVQFPKSAICQKMKLTYIIKPSSIDLLLQRNLNVKSTVCKEIVNNTVRFLKGVFRGDYEAYLNENIMIE